MRSYNTGLPARVVRFGLFRVRSPLLAESWLFSLPPGTEMVHFPGFAPTAYGFSCRRREFAPARFPHSDIPGSQLAYSSPRLFAVSHVLHRLLSPRHPPYALSSLTTKFTRNQILSARGDDQGRSSGRRSWSASAFFAPAAPRTALSSTRKQPSDYSWSRSAEANRLFFDIRFSKNRVGAFYGKPPSRDIRGCLCSNA